ncbi:MAG: metal-sulfur cluster assembly factor [Candidatus Diapherotrites archaeon]|uniref:Metal-sulfur cluster assembly factor n=1 Tax=Candidatus Iainarchaeum sp. TaxID=3101447 RepID=A0A8T4L2W9_9ARCH|nr:metal-sulfur cluster assembly factor [Candidatus Diapherotrites archaeon]
MITTEKLVEALKQVFDPEIPINVYDLGLIYEHRVNPDDSIYIKATMTSPACPYAGILLADLKSKVKQLTGATQVDVELTFSPLWTTDKMTEEGKAQFEVF